MKTKEEKKPQVQEVKFSYSPVPHQDMEEFKRQMEIQKTSHPDYVDDRNPENYLFRCERGY